MIFYVIVPNNPKIEARKFVPDCPETWLDLNRYIARLLKDGNSVHIERDFSRDDM